MQAETTPESGAYDDKSVTQQSRSCTSDLSIGSAPQTSAELPDDACE